MPQSSTSPDAKDLPATVRRTMETYHMLTPGDRVLVGVSGGPDSMALLHILSRLANELKIRLGVAHLNHCLRGVPADKDARVVDLAAATLKHPCHMGRARVIKVKRQLGLSLEEAGRRVRYAFFNKIMIDTGYNKLALGHHWDDNAEQMLMALLRGSGPRGLSGIAPVRQRRIIRPLIDARRSQIEDYLQKEGISSVQDASNEDLHFVRNRIRHHLLPLLAADYNPRISDHLNRLAEVTRTEEKWINGLVSNKYELAVCSREKGIITLSVDTVSASHPALARRLIRHALEELTGTLRRITFTHIQSVLRLLMDGGNEKECHLPGGIRARRTGDRIIIKVTNEHHRMAAEPAVEEERVSTTVIPTPFPKTLEIHEMGIGFRFLPCRPNQLPRWENVNRNQAYFDLKRLSMPLTVRSAVPGDRFTPLGATGSQKLKKFFIDHRIPRRDREMVPVLADQKRIVWLVGQRMDDHAKVSADTSQVLSVEFFLLDTR